MASSLFSPSELSYTSTPLSASSTPLFRTDARTPLAYRDIVLDTHVVEGTIGSAKVVVGGLGGYTEVWAGVRGEVEDLPKDAEGEGHGRVVVSVECAPTALPSLRADLPLHLSSLLTTLFSPSSLPAPLLAQLLVLPHSKAWTLYLDILILSSDGGNVLDLSIMAARSALAVTRVPKTRGVGYEKGETVDKEGVGIEGDSGITGLVKGGKAGRDVVDFELVDGGWEEGDRLEGWEDLPVALTLNLINQLPHLDATTLEESATASQIVFCFTSKGDVCGVKQIGEGEIEWARLMPLLGEARRFSSELIQVLNAKLRDA